MRIGSTFAGIGGFDLAFERAGATVAWQIEIDPTCRRVLERHWPEVRRHDDIRTATDAALAPVDVITGGWPCQDLSVAGQRAGLSGARSGLFYDLCRLIATLRPTWIVLENVPGLLSSAGGRDMGAVLGALVDLGYSVAYRVLDAQFYGVPKRRRRVFFVGHLGDDWRAPAAVLFDSASCRWDLAPRRKAGTATATLLASGAGAGRPAGIASETDFLVAGTLGGGSGQRGWADDLDRSGAFIPMTARPLKAGGNDRQDESHETYVAHTLRTSCRNNSNPVTEASMLVAHSLSSPRSGMRFDPNGETYVVQDAAYALRSDPGGTGQGHNVTYVIQDVRGGTRDKTDHGQGMGIRNDGLCYTLNATEQHAVAATLPADHRIRSDGNADNLIPSGMAVRRLTPRECERLQGFPDDWTAYGSNGKPISDSARYRMLGNAVAVPVVEWIARRLMAVEVMLVQSRVRGCA